MLLLFWRGSRDDLELVSSGTSTAVLALGVRRLLQLEATGRAETEPIESAPRRGVSPQVAGRTTATLVLGLVHQLELTAAGSSSCELEVRARMRTDVLADGTSTAAGEQLALRVALIPEAAGETTSVARTLRHPIPATIRSEVLAAALVASSVE